MSLEQLREQEDQAHICCKAGSIGLYLFRRKGSNVISALEHFCMGRFVKYLM